MKKTTIIFTILLIINFTIHAKTLISFSYENDHKSYYENLNIDYYDNGIMKTFNYFTSNDKVSYEFSIVDQNSNSIKISRKNNIYKMENESFLFSFTNEELTVQRPDKSVITYDIEKYNKRIIIKNRTFFIQFGCNNFSWKNKNLDLRYKDNIVYDYNSYGEFFSNSVIQPYLKIEDVSADAARIGWYTPDENETGFKYHKEGTYILKYSDLNIPDIYKFINYIITTTYYDITDVFVYFLSDFSLTDSQNSILKYKASSELKEKTYVYEAENLGTIEGNPWASANGFGIGDKISIYIELNNFEELLLYNGFQSSKNSYLFKQNSRVKKLRLTDVDSNLCKEIEIRDTKNPQTIDFRDIIKTNNRTVRLILEVLDVYSGQKYDDLCIQAILIK